VAFSLYEKGEFADPYCLPTGPTAHMPPLHRRFSRALPVPRADARRGVRGLVPRHRVPRADVRHAPVARIRLGLGPWAGSSAGSRALPSRGWPSFTNRWRPSRSPDGGCVPRRWTSGRATDGGSLALGLATGLSFLVAPSLLPVAWDSSSSSSPGFGSRGAGSARRFSCSGWRSPSRRDVAEHDEARGLFFVRSNFGLELRMGNHDGAGANLELSARGGTEPTRARNEEEARKVGSSASSVHARGGTRGRRLDPSHPAGFLRLTGLRVAQFWFGRWTTCRSPSRSAR